MDKIKLESSNIADENFEKLASLFPNVVTETIVNDRVERAIDIEKLKQEINAHILSENEECYNFTWPDKRKSVVLANAPTRNTLRACKEESKDFDNTENLYIEGDNLEVLKLLRNTYMGKVKMIYIDPPYNTGKDFVYQDNFYINKEEYKEMSGQFDKEGNRLFENTEANGRFHTDWLNMMYPRLKMARDLLTDDGVIFISIDDNEVSNLRKICDEIFGGGEFCSKSCLDK
ncbi:MAG: site-specific DNA-methyltransferase [Mucispirillum sp.]|nr:site-specific DNA-methyltransferase [Mucispirillum sp.]